MEGWEVVTDAEEEGSERTGMGSVCCMGRTREDERRLPRVFIERAGRTHVEEARLRLGGGTAKAMTEATDGWIGLRDGQKSNQYVIPSNRLFGDRHHQASYRMTHPIC